MAQKIIKYDISLYVRSGKIDALKTRTGWAPSSLIFIRLAFLYFFLFLNKVEVGVWVKIWIPREVNALLVIPYSYPSKYRGEELIRWPTFLTMTPYVFELGALNQKIYSLVRFIFRFSLVFGSIFFRAGHL